MSRCPTCKDELEQERIGGTPRQPGRLVLLCTACRRVFPFDVRPALHLVTGRRDIG
ncbi:MAG: hypothetical protein ACOYXM_01720 [Actinomycetota bacterium]